MIESHVYQALAEVVGPDFVSDDPAIRQAYSKDVGFPALVRKYKKDPLAVPDLVVLPGSTGEVRAVLRIATRYQLKVIPITTGANREEYEGLKLRTVCLEYT